MINIFLLLALSFSNAALDARYDDFEDFELIRALVDDNKLDLAEKELKELKGDVALYSYWSGVVNYKKGQFEEALRFLKKARFDKNQSEFEKQQLFLARTEKALKNFSDCANTFTVIEKSIHYSDGDSIMHAECFEKSAQIDKAWSIFAKRLQSSQNIDVLVSACTFLMSQKLIHVATHVSLDWLAKNSKQSSDFISISDLFQKFNFTQSRLSILEMARVKYPLDIDVNLSLNQIYFEKGMLLAVEEGFSRAALSDGKYAYHSAEINRQVGRYERSLFFNARIVDEKERLKQKLAIYVDKGQFALIASLEPILQRSPLINDDEVRYALAYSLVRSGEYKRPLQYLAKITNKDFLEKAVILRNALSECVANNTVCKL